MITEAQMQARNSLGLRYRRGIGALLFAVIAVALLLAGQNIDATRALFLQMDVKNERSMRLGNKDRISIERDLGGRIDEMSKGCWLELSGGRLGRIHDDKVEVLELREAERDPDVRSVTGAEEESVRKEIAGVTSDYCWRQTANNMLVESGRRGNIYVLESFTSAASVRGLGGFAGTLLVFLLAGLMATLIVRRPIGGEVALGAVAPVGMELLRLRSMLGGDLGILFRSPVEILTPLGYTHGYIFGATPFLFLSLVPLLAIGVAALTTLTIDQAHGERRCDFCIAPVPLFPSDVPCSNCGAQQPSHQVEWLGVSAAVLGGGLLIAGLLALGDSLLFFNQCTLGELTEACKEAREVESGMTGWESWYRRGLTEDDPSIVILFRPAVYVGVLLPLFALLPFVTGRMIRRGYRTALAVIPLLLLTVFLVTTFTVVPGDAGNLLFVMVRTHITGGVLLGIVGFIAALRGGRGAGGIVDASELEL